MATFILIDENKLTTSFLGMSTHSKHIHSATKDKLLSSGKVSVSNSDILGQEYLMWLEKKGVVKRR